MKRRTGRATTTARLTQKQKNPETGRMKGVTIQEVDRSKVLGLRGGDGMVSVNQGITKGAPNFSSVRVDVRVEMPCDQTEKSLKETTLQCKEYGRLEMDQIIPELLEALTAPIDRPIAAQPAEEPRTRTGKVNYE